MIIFHEKSRGFFGGGGVGETRREVENSCFYMKNWTMKKKISIIGLLYFNILK